jgi:lysyl endopeptidase
MLRIIRSPAEIRITVLMFILAALVGGGMKLTPASASPSDQRAGQGSSPQSLEQVETLVMPPVDVPTLLAEDELRAAQGLPPRFAQPIVVEITPWNHGTWDMPSSGLSRWRLQVLSKGALSLNLGFTTYWMPKGGSLYLYPPDRSRVVGPFTEVDNEQHGQLWSPIILGDEMVIEVTIPTDQVGKFRLNLTSINHGYAAFGRSHTVTSGSCNVDVVCPEGDAWREQIRSVAVISTGGSTFCTGFLVNNTAQDLKGYFMTANHCGINAGNAASLVTYWNYENSWCRPVNDPINSQPGDGTLNQYNTGSYFRASYSASDFTLVELDDTINPEYNVYWAGWDHSGADATSATAIHHPNTDEKRISFEYDPTSVTSYLGTSVPGDATHVRITDWDLGTTEPGSSGSPLFDQNHRVIGQLHGGYAACGNDDSDWYGRFYSSWTGGGTPTTRLSDWLDPLNTGKPWQDGRNLVVTPFTVITDPIEVNTCAPDPAVYGITITQETEGYFDPVSLSILGVPEGAAVEFTVNPVVPTFTSTLTVTQTELALPGSYAMDLIGVETTNTYTVSVTLNIFEGLPDLPTLLSPADGAVAQLLQPVFTWEGAPFSSLYSFRLDQDPLFPAPVLVDQLEDPTFTPSSPLEGGRCYWWEVATNNACGRGSWSALFHFATTNLGITFADDIESGGDRWTHAAVQGADHWEITTDRSHSPTHAWFVPDVNTITDSRLWTTDPIMVGKGSLLTFWHLYQFEGDNFDGAVLEISTDGGSTWDDLGPFITANGYNGVVNAAYSNPLANQNAWVGVLTSWTEVKVDLSGYAGQEVQIRWRIGCDSSNSDVGWFIDDVQLSAPLPPNPAPVLSGMAPNEGSATENTPVVITGGNFIATPAAQLGETWLISVTQVSSTTLNAVVPAGIPSDTYTLTLYNGDCQESTLPDAFTIDVPIAGLSAESDSPTLLGDTTTFTAMLTAGTNVSYSWDFGDGSLGADGEIVTHTYAEPGVYLVTLTATNFSSSVQVNLEVEVIVSLIKPVYLPLMRK